jgi:hypothetical protein
MYIFRQLKVQVINEKIFFFYKDHTEQGNY